MVCNYAAVLIEAEAVRLFRRVRIDYFDCIGVRRIGSDNVERISLAEANMDNKRSMNMHNISTMPKRKAPSLVDLCIFTAIDNVRYLGDVGETDEDFLDRILPHCTLDELMHVEKSTVGRDLGPVTDKLWKKFYEKHFGRESMDHVVERMKQKNVSFRWIQLYEAKLKDRTEAMNKSVDRLKQLYKDEDARKQKRTIQLCSKVPPSNKRRFCGGSGPGNLSNVKSNMMRKAKSEFLNSVEMKNIAAMRKNSLQRNNRTSPMMKPGGSGVKNFASTSRHERS